MSLKAALFWFCCFRLTERGSAAVMCRRLHAALPPEVEPPQRRWALLRPLSYLNDNECDPVTGITLNNYVTNASGLCLRPLFIYYLSSLSLSNFLGSLAYIFIALLLYDTQLCLSTEPGMTLPCLLSVTAYAFATQNSEFSSFKLAV